MITAVIIAKNESSSITNAIISLKHLTKDIVVLDDSSTDDTAKISQKNGAKVVSIKSGLNFSQKRNYILNKLKSEWVFYLDADERISKPLAEEIINLISRKDSVSAYWVKRRNFILGKELKSKTWYPDSQPRLFKMTKFKGWTGHIHESADFEGEKSVLNNEIFHFTHKSIFAMIEKTNNWSEIEAQNLYKINHPKINRLRLFKLFISQFFIKYINEQNYKNGTIGLIESFMQTYSTMITYFKLWELQQDPTIEEQYKILDQELQK